MVSSLPLAAQYFIRDNCFRGIADNGISLSAFLMLFTQPHVAAAFVRLSSGLQTHYYNGVANRNQFVEVMQTGRHTGPIVMFVHGGAWGSGKPWMYRLAAQGLGEVLGASAVVLVGYEVYPDATIPAQLDNVRRARLFVHQSRAMLQLSASAPIVMSGHSSGANLCALVALDESRLCQGLVLFSGVFDIHRHYLYESSRGVQNISPMFPAAEGHVAGMERHSPNLRFAAWTESQLTGEEGGGGGRYVPPCLLVHYTEDDTVPFTSSSDFAYTLSSLGGRVSTVFVRGSHVDPILDLMRPMVAVFKVAKSDEQFNNLLKDFAARVVLEGPLLHDEHGNGGGDAAALPPHRSKL